MFTGIVAAKGSVRARVPTVKGARVTLAAGGLDLADVQVGDSIAVNGCCLTVIELATDAFAVDVSQETLDCTVGFTAGATVNLEKALRLSDRLGGHLVSGHVDGVGEVTRFEPAGESWLLEVRSAASVGEVHRPQGLGGSRRRQPDGQSGRGSALHSQSDSAHTGGNEPGGIAGGQSRQPRGGPGCALRGTAAGSRHEGQEP